VSQAGAGDLGRHVKGRARPQAARSFEGQPEITGTDPGTSPGSGARPSLTDHLSVTCPWVLPSSGGARRYKMVAIGTLLTAEPVLG
jgi:hypothetical protein